MTLDGAGATPLTAFRVSEGPAHHFVGFNDVDPWSSDHEHLLCLRVNDMRIMPTGKSEAEVGIIHLQDRRFTPVAITTGWNFPQGARQQWIRRAGVDAIVFNVADHGEWRSRLIDSTGKVLMTCQKAVYSVAPNGADAYGINFSRAFRLGGYGYAGLADTTAGDKMPAQDGIWHVSLTTGEATVLLSTREVAQTPGVANVLAGADHYLTHVLPSPDGESLAFLHRFWLPDGGIHTRLVVHQVRQGTTEVWAEGFVSHFDWIDSGAILVWTRSSGLMQTLRSSSALSRLPYAGRLIGSLKPLARLLLPNAVTTDAFYKRVSSDSRFSREMFRPSLPRRDGHPSFCPANRDWLLLDTYPDAHGTRALMLYDLGRDKLLSLGSYRQHRALPSYADLAQVANVLAPMVLTNFGRRHYVATRSGIHCDLHPRWRSDGRYICFDSNHEGSRQIYLIYLGALTSP